MASGLRCLTGSTRIQRSVLVCGAVVSALCTLLSGWSHGQENCCHRYVYTAPFKMPPGDSERWGRFASGDATSPLHDGTLQGTDCPLEVNIIGRQSDQDYRFEGEVTTEGLVQTDEFGNLHGRFIAKLRLVDPDHGNTVLREAAVAWSGTLTDGFNHKIYKYEPSTDSLNPSWQDRTGEMGKQFFDIQGLIYDYEGKPQKCVVKMPEGQESVQSGQTITIDVADIIDHQGRRPPHWQRVLVRVDKGRILNADEQWNDFYVFKLREAGDVAVQYRAPDACRPDKVTLTVWNTCTKSEGRPHISGNEFQVAKKEFDIVCDQWDVKITYTENVGGSYQMGEDQRATVSRTYSGTFKARVKLVKSDRRVATYESTDAEVQISDNYNFNRTGGESGCAWNGGFNGSKGGRVQLPIRFRLNTHNHTYSVGLGKWDGDGTTYTLGGNLHGKPPCTGGWQQEVNSTELPRGWEKGLVEKPQGRTWSPGQTSFTFENSWDDFLTGIWPASDATPPPHPSFMVPVAWRLTYAPQAFDSNRQPGMKIKRSLAWNVTRPK